MSETTGGAPWEGWSGRGLQGAGLSVQPEDEKELMRRETRCAKAPQWRGHIVGAPRGRKCRVGNAGGEASQMPRVLSAMVRHLSFTLSVLGTQCDFVN